MFAINHCYLNWSTTLLRMLLEKLFQLIVACLFSICSHNLHFTCSIILNSAHDYLIIDLDKLSPSKKKEIQTNLWHFEVKINIFEGKPSHLFILFGLHKICWIFRGFTILQTQQILIISAYKWIFPIYISRSYSYIKLQV